MFTVGQAKRTLKIKYDDIPISNWLTWDMHIDDVAGLKMLVSAQSFGILEILNDMKKT